MNYMMKSIKLFGVYRDHMQVLRANEWIVLNTSK